MEIIRSGVLIRRNMIEKAITLKGLTAEIGDAGKAAEIYKKISILGGFGNVHTGYLGGPPALDVNSVSEASRKQFSDLIAAAKKQVADAKKTEK